VTPPGYLPEDNHNDINTWEGKGTVKVKVTP
jgi:hypothetical protein